MSNTDKRTKRAKNKVFMDFFFHKVTLAKMDKSDGH